MWRHSVRAFTPAALRFSAYRLASLMTSSSSTYSTSGGAWKRVGKTSVTCTTTTSSWSIWASLVARSTAFSAYFDPSTASKTVPNMELTSERELTVSIRLELRSAEGRGTSCRWVIRHDGQVSDTGC